MKMTHNEILDAVDEIGKPILILTSIGEALIHPDTEDSPWAMEYLSGDIRIYNLKYLQGSEKGYSKTVEVLDWF